MLGCGCGAKAKRSSSVRPRFGPRKKIHARI
jgi:hypothetical protein